MLVRRLHLMAGRRDAAELRRLASALAALPTGPASRAAIHLAWAGDLARAEAVARGVAGESVSRAVYEGVAAWRRGDAAGGADRLGPLRARSLALEDEEIPFEAPWFLYGEALHEAGLHERAIEALRRAQGLFAVNWMRPWALPRSRLLLARSLAALGRRGEALEELSRLTSELRRADPDDPHLREARTLADDLGAALLHR